MRRADRLFQIVQLIRGRRLTTAAHLAQRLEVSERTIYRDVADLQHQGVPIEGEAGVRSGRRDFDPSVLAVGPEPGVGAELESELLCVEGDGCVLVRDSKHRDGDVVHGSPAHSMVR